MDLASAQEPEQQTKAPRGFHVESQAVTYDVDFRRQLLRGSTEITIQPHSNTLKQIRLHCRQCTVRRIIVAGKDARWTYKDPYEAIQIRNGISLRQHHFLKQKVDAALAGSQEEELVIDWPPRVSIKESEQYRSLQQDAPELLDSAVEAGEVGRYESVTLTIEFETTGERDGLQWVGCTPGDDQWPHVYTRNSPFRGIASCLVPCLDDPSSRHPWIISFKCPRTLGDAFSPTKAAEPSAGTAAAGDGNAEPSSDVVMTDAIRDIELSEQEQDLELTVICSGEATGETADNDHQDLHTCSFSVQASVAANQWGFAIGPFEHVDLSEFRELDDDEKLGEAAIRVHGYCLPGRAPEVKNTCMPMAKAIDFFTTQFTTYTGESFNLCFVDDLSPDTTETAGLSLCSTRLLFPEDIIDPLDRVTRTLVKTLATQWAGIHLVPKAANDAWVVAGIRSFMTDIFLRELSGNNEYRYQLKLASDKIFQQDFGRPSLYDLGTILELDPEEGRFMSAKAGLVFFILDRRLVKASGSSGMSRIVGRVLNNAKADDADASYIATQQFMTLCNKMGHIKLESFFQQWVYSAGCPSFEVMQEMNKKKLMVLMTIKQNQYDSHGKTRYLNPNSFLRELKEEHKEIYQGELPSPFVGSMTIRIHESDGTPYEHVVDINKSHMKIEIPYNTKYKRMRRGKRKKDDQIAAAEDAHDDVLLYCLGDNLQTEDDIHEWKLTDWDADTEARMKEESYEWIRMDADFEWMCKMNIQMPAYMWMSQLQQDRDVVAQMESVQWLNYETTKTPHPLSSTYLARTLLDRRYFHGVRTMAASTMPNCATQKIDWIGRYHLEKAFNELYAMPGSSMPKPNDFSDRISYEVQLAIVKAMSDIRDDRGITPMEVKRFFMDKLKFNDNSSNDLDDSFYVSTLLECLTKTLIEPRRNEDDMEVDEHVLRREAVAEIERYRRVNEWSPSYHNVFTTTALDCLVKLGRTGVVQPKFQDFLRYTQADNSDHVRLKAFDCLVELDLHREEVILAYMINEIAAEPSPYVRENLFRIVGRALGKIAIGEKQKPKELPAIAGGLVIEQQQSSKVAEATVADEQRRTMVTAAMRALKGELAESKIVQEAFWSAVKSPLLSLRELADFLEICSVIYETEDTFPITMKLPRYYRCRNEGNGKLQFTKTGFFRTKPYVPLDWSKIKPKPAPAPALPAKPPPSRRTSSFASSTPGPMHLTNGASAPTPASASASASASATSQSTDTQRRGVLKLKLGGRTSSTTTSSAMSPPPATSSPSIQTTHAPTNGATPHAPLGFGKISASPAPSSPFSPQAPLQQQQAGLMPDAHAGTAANGRPSSSGSTSTTASGKGRKKSTTPAPPRSSTQTPAPELAGGRSNGTSRNGSRAPSRAASPGVNGADGANGVSSVNGRPKAVGKDATSTESLSGSMAAPATGKKRKSETPQPDGAKEPPTKKTIKLKFGRGG